MPVDELSFVKPSLELKVIAFIPLIFSCLCSEIHSPSKSLDTSLLQHLLIGLTIYIQTTEDVMVELSDASSQRVIPGISETSKSPKPKRLPPMI